MRLNIGGSSYRIRAKSILKHGPSTFLGKFLSLSHEKRLKWADSYFEDSQEYFFERAPRLIIFFLDISKNIKTKFGTDFFYVSISSAVQILWNILRLRRFLVFGIFII